MKKILNICTITHIILTIALCACYIIMRHDIRDHNTFHTYDNVLVTSVDVKTHYSSRHTNTHRVYLYAYELECVYNNKCIKRNITHDQYLQYKHMINKTITCDLRKIDTVTLTRFERFMYTDIAAALAVFLCIGAFQCLVQYIEYKNTTYIYVYVIVITILLMIIAIQT